jgi:hypothetical protein
MYIFFRKLNIISAIVFLSSIVHGEETSVKKDIFFDRGSVALSDKYLEASNPPANFDTSIRESWQGSFVYWSVTQDYMDVARASTEPGNNQTVTGVDYQHYFNYQPGFKIAISTELYRCLPDGWVIDTVYTRLHSQLFHSKMAPNDQKWTANNWFISPPFDAVRYTSKWKMNLDVLEEFLNRPFYVGRQLILNPCVGLRILLISQAFRINFFNDLNERAYSINYSRSISTGLYLGMKSRWLLGKGVYFEGNVATSYLPVNLPKISHRELGSYGGTPNASGTHTFVHKPFSTSEGGFGFGWGTYYNVEDEKRSKTYTAYFDLSARWDWMILWEQNLMRKWVGELAGLANPTGDLNMNGFTFTASCYF